MSEVGTRADYILVVEDAAVVSQLLQVVLTAAGYRVVIACHGRAALAHLRSHPAPGLILLDLAMPVMNGWEFIAEQRRDPRLRKIPVLILSSEGNLEEQAAALEVEAFLDKPFNISALLRLVRPYFLDQPQPAALPWSPAGGTPRQPG